MLLFQASVLTASFHLHNAYFKYRKDTCSIPDIYQKLCIRNCLPVLHALPPASEQKSVSKHKSTKQKKTKNEQQAETTPKSASPKSYIPIIKGPWIEENITNFFGGEKKTAKVLVQYIFL